MPRPLAEQVVVITGASSGIGRCTAVYLAARGARVVLTARSAEALDGVARQIRDAGGQTLVVPGDVRSEEDMAAVADAAVDRFGGIDTWINNAGVYFYGAVVDFTLDDFRAALETDLIGVINGTRQALRHMLPARAGVIIQISSILARRGAPFTAPYSAAKAGIDGFCDALRAELWGSGVQVSTLYVPSVDTLIYQHARSRFATKPAAVPPVHDPIVVARKIANLAVAPRPEAYIGAFRYAYLGLGGLFPRVTDWFLHHASGIMEGPVPTGPDNVDAPVDSLPPAIRGGWGRRGLKGFTVSGLVHALPWEAVLAAGLVGFWAGRLWAKQS